MSVAALSRRLHRLVYTQGKCLLPTEILLSLFLSKNLGLRDEMRIGTGIFTFKIKRLFAADKNVVTWQPTQDIYMFAKYS